MPVDADRLVRVIKAISLAQNHLGSSNWVSPLLFVTDIYHEAGIVLPGGEYECKRAGWWVKIGDPKIGGPILGDILVHVDGMGIMEKSSSGWYETIELPGAPPNRTQRVQRIKHSILNAKLRGFIRPEGFVQ